MKMKEMKTSKKNSKLYLLIRLILKLMFFLFVISTLLYSLQLKRVYRHEMLMKAKAYISICRKGILLQKIPETK